MHIFGAHPLLTKPSHNLAQNIKFLFTSEIPLPKLCIDTICASRTLPLGIPPSSRRRNVSMANESVFSGFVFCAVLVFPVLDKYMCRRSGPWSSVVRVYKPDEWRMAAAYSLRMSRIWINPSRLANYWYLLDLIFIFRTLCSSTPMWAS